MKYLEYKIQTRIVHDEGWNCYIFVQDLTRPVDPAELASLGWTVQSNLCRWGNAERLTMGSLCP